MRKYESIVIFSGSLSDSQLKTEIDKVKKSIKENAASNIEVQSWGKKETAYKMKKQGIGYYEHFSYETDNNEIVSELHRSLSLNDQIIKFQSHRVVEKTRKFRGMIRKTDDLEQSLSA